MVGTKEMVNQSNIAHVYRKASSEEWNTPQHLVDKLDTFFGGPVGLDPCHNLASKVKASLKFGHTQTGYVDALEQQWIPPLENKTVYLNPPSKKSGSYSYQGRFVERLLEGMEAGMYKTVAMNE